jgi:uncharacterized oxidoreductase
MMKISGNTALITGGASGIGFELAAALLARGNRVIITGRNPAALEDAKRKLPDVQTIVSDVGDPQAIVALHRAVVDRFPELNMIVNNAGIMRKIDFRAAGTDLADIAREIDINLTGSIRMVMQFLPHLLTRPKAAIVNVSSGLAFVPLPTAPVYCATKAAIHSFSQSLRIQLERTSVAVFELAPPLTETHLFAGDFKVEELGGVKAMDVKALVGSALAGIERDRFEIRPGASNMLNLMSRIAPAFILAQLAKPARAMRTGAH